MEKIHNDMMYKEHLLTSTNLFLAQDIEKLSIDDNNLIIKNPAFTTFLSISKIDWNILQQFSNGLTGTELISNIISQTNNISLADLYRLIQKATQSKILIQNQNEDDKINNQIKWPIRLNSFISHCLAIVIIISGIIGLFYNGISIPENFIHIFIGILISSLCVSLGYLLAAGILKYYNLTVYRPTFVWKSLIPHLNVNTSSAIIGGRYCLTGVALMRLLPLFFVSALIFLWIPQVEYILFLAILLLIAPCQNTPIFQIITAFNSSTNFTNKFGLNFYKHFPLIKILSKNKKTKSDKYLINYSFCLLFWVIFNLFSHIILFYTYASQILVKNINSSGIDLPGSIVLITISTLLLLSVYIILWIVISNIKYLIEKYIFKYKNWISGNEVFGVPQSSILQILNNSLIFKDCIPDTISLISEKIQCIEYESNKNIIENNETSDSMYLIYSGKIEIIKDNDDLLPSRIAILEFGDSLLETALLDNFSSEFTYRTLSNVILLKFSKDSFNKLKDTPYGNGVILNSLNKLSFLSHVKFCSQWHPKALLKFSTLLVFNNIEKNEALINRGYDSNFIHIVFKGNFIVKKDFAVLATLSQANIFGEKNLYNDTVSSADVIATEASQCFTIHVSDFIQFINIDFFTGFSFSEL